MRKKKHATEEFMADKGTIGNEEISKAVSEEEIAAAAADNAQRLRNVFPVLNSMHSLYNDWLETEQNEVMKKLEIIKKHHKNSKKGKKALKSVISDYEYKLEYLESKKERVSTTTRILSGLLNSKISEQEDINNLIEIDIISKTEKQNLSYIG